MTNREAYQLITLLIEMPVISDTKLEHAKNQTLKNAASFIEAYNDKLEDLSIEYCSTDEKGNIIKDQRNQYLFKKDKQRALSKELKTFMESDLIIPFTIVPTADTKGLTEGQHQYLSKTGFILER